MFLDALANNININFLRNAFIFAYLLDVTKVLSQWWGEICSNDMSFKFAAKFTRTLLCHSWSVLIEMYWEEGRERSYLFLFAEYTTTKLMTVPHPHPGEVCTLSQDVASLLVERFLPGKMSFVITAGP